MKAKRNAAPDSRTEFLAVAALAFRRGQLHALFTVQERQTLEAAWADYAAGALTFEELADVQRPIAAATVQRLGGKGKR